MTIAQYASKWAVVEHRANLKNNPLWVRATRQNIFFQWAEADEDSPIFKALQKGANRDDIKDKFDAAFDQMMTLLSKMEGTPDRDEPAV